MTKQWTASDVMEMARSYQPACVLAAAVDLDLFTPLAAGGATAAELARRLEADLRGLTILLDALAALEVLRKDGDRYRLADGLAAVLTTEGQHSMLAMAQHQANCLRRWAQLAVTIKAGQPAPRQASVRSAEADYTIFIEAMDNLSRTMAGPLVEKLGSLEFSRLLDVGGASGSWTIAFLRRYPRARATLFDLPVVIPMARQRLGEAGVLGRVELVSGDFYSDALPEGADLAWVSAIVHQNSRQQNRDLFAKLSRALAPGGQVLIRDIVMDESRTSPVSGALFAVNMLAATPSGGTFTLSELREDLESCGFGQVSLLHQGQAMDSVVGARKT